MNSLVVDRLSRTYSGRRVLDDVSFTCQGGGVTVLLGPNGAGKTTLFRCLSGLLQPDSGSIEFRRDTAAGRQEGLAVAYLSESPELYAGLSVIEHVRFIALLHRIPDWQNRSEQLLETFGLQDSRDQLPHELSQGMRKKVALTMAVLQGARVLLLDEPFNGLDPRAAWDLRHLIGEAAAQGAIVLVSTHRLAEAETFASQALILSSGRMLASGSLSDLMDRTKAGAHLEEVFFSLTEGASDG